MIKSEINKLHSCSREIISAGGSLHQANESVMKKLTYEKLNQQIEDLLKDHNYY